MTEWKIETETGTRLDKFVQDKTEGYSRTRIQQLIEEGNILVNNEVSKSNYKVRLGE